MAKILSVASRAGLARVLNPVAQTALRAGVTPNVVTVVGTIGVLVGAVGFAARGYMLIAIVIVAISALTDLVDGAMARARGQVGKFGALLDSTMDRVADGAIFGSLAYWFATTGEYRAASASILCLVSGLVVSYVKARAEGLGFTCNVGLIERAERLILAGIGAVLYTVHVPYGYEIILWVLAILSLLTIWQRMFHVCKCDRAAQIDRMVHETRAASGGQR